MLDLVMIDNKSIKNLFLWLCLFNGLYGCLFSSLLLVNKGNNKNLTQLKSQAKIQLNLLLTRPQVLSKIVYDRR